MRTLVISDFDDTMWMHNDNDEQTVENLIAIDRFRQMGGLFGIATGRSIAALKYTFPEFYRHVDVLITLDGAGVYLMKSGRLEEVATVKMPAKEAAGINKIITRRARRRWRDRIFFQGEKEMEKYTDGYLSKVRVWCTDDADCANLHQMLTEKGFNADFWLNIPAEWNFDMGRLKWVHGDMRHCLDISPRGVNKAAGIKLLLPHLVDDIHVVTAGDSSNDFEMVQQFDGYAVGENPGLSGALADEEHRVKSLSEIFLKIPPS